MSAVIIDIPPTAEGYATFIRCKSLPSYRVVGRTVETDEASYRLIFGAGQDRQVSTEDGHLFDYQAWVTNLALDRQRFAVFMDCGLGKTAVEVAWAHAIARKFGRVLFLAPLAVVEDIQRFTAKFYGYRMSNLRSEPWQTDVAILNIESRRDVDMTNVVGVVLDESSCLKSETGETRKWVTALVKPCRFRLACSATPSPNELAEYATHAVWLGHATTLNEFYGQFFRKDGTEWRLKGHAHTAFYRNLRSWCTYIQSPSTLGFKDHQAELRDPPIYHEIRTDAPDYKPKDKLFQDAVSLGESREIFGAMRADITQPRFKESVAAIEGKRAIVWCSRNAEEDAFRRAIGGHVISGATPVEERVDLIDDFRAGRTNTLISKPSVLGFGVNLPEATDMLYSGYTFSFEQFYQAVRRAHRFGREGRLTVHVPVTDIEQPVWGLLQGKMRTFDKDVQTLQSMFAQQKDAA
jgi:hypothetical protein